ncbi:MAG: S9 family peptidase [Rikenellaceae bacterium]|jgi:dipeptidyl aminopeptidase/acylaminoacyl peptidase|nr:S9 family peptidase [Rikenellaceae bacterium]
MTMLSTGCASLTENAPQPLEINNALTAEEITAGRLTPEVMWKMARVGDFAVSPDGQQVLFGLTSYNMAENRGVTSLWTQNVNGGEATRITDHSGSESSPVWSADGEHIYFLSDRSGSSQLWTARPDGSDMHQISSLEGDIESFGIAPSGDRIFYVQRVKVEQRISSELYPDLDKSKARVYDDLMVRHWDRWTDGSHLHIFVAEFDGARLSAGEDIMTGEPWDSPMEPYFDAAEIAWNNVGTALAYTCKKLTGAEYATSTDSDIYLYDVASKETTNINKKGGESVFVGYDRYPVFSPDDTKIAFTSMSRAGNESDKDRLMVYDLATETFSDLTTSFDYSAANIIWNGSAELYFIAPYIGTYQLCRVDLAGNVTLVTSGDHDINHVDARGGTMIASRTRIDHAAELYTLDPATGAMTQLTDVNPEIYANVRMGAVEKRWVKTTDGKDMLTWVVYPPDFDPTKKYPALLYCEGGPQSTVSQFWSYRWNFQLMAAQGYIVVAPNRRGTPSFGTEWVDQISGDYSGQNIRDLLSAIDAVAAEAFVDNDRLGCVGASYGGYSAFYLAGVHQKRFKAFIAHCGIFDFTSMYGETEELFFVNNDYGDPYWSDSPTAQRSYANSPHQLVKNWDTPILIFTGLNDFRIPYTQSLEAHTAARMLGVPSRLVAFENEAHQVFKPQNSLVWNREFFSWLDKYVKDKL